MPDNANEERLVDPTPELMRLRIISVAALNCGTYLGVDSLMISSMGVIGADVPELEAWGESILKRF